MFKRTIIFAAFAIILLPVIALSTTYNTPTLDGSLADWATDELIDANDCNILAPSQAAYVLYVTWDATNLYVGIDRSSTGRFLGEPYTGIEDSFFVAFDTDQTTSSGAGSDGYGRVNFGDADSLPEVCYYFAGGGGWFEWSSWNGSAWDWNGWDNTGTYYGWDNPGNYDDELTIPWANLGGPSTIRMYAWMTEEGSGNIEDAWPLGNPNGTSPTFSAYYEFNPLTSGQNPQDQLGQADASDIVTELNFGDDFDNLAPFGLPGTGIAIEETLDISQDDFYRWPSGAPLNHAQTIDEAAPGLQIGTGRLVVTSSLDFFNSPLDLAVSEVMHDDLGSLFFCQFTVNPDSVGLPVTDVFTEAASVPSEEGGDVFECPGNGAGGGSLGNMQVMDETALGLFTSPENDINALVVNDPLPADTVDTDGVGGADTPMVYFTVKNNVPPTDPESDDIAMTAPFGGYPMIYKTATELGLSIAASPHTDIIDALYIDITGDVFFSLERNSPMLTAGTPGSAGPIVNWFTGAPGFGADPGDIIAVTPGVGGAAPATPPMVVITATMLGLFGNGIGDPGIGEDDLNGLHFTDVPTKVNEWMLH